MENVKKKIQEFVDYETKGWNAKNPDLFFSIIHPDMVWPVRRKLWIIFSTRGWGFFLFLVIR